MRAFAVAIASLLGMTLGRAGADPVRVTVTDTELAAARAAKIGCADLGEVFDVVQSRTAIKLMIRACRRDRWALAPIVCYLREGLDGYAGCETLLTKRERARLVAALTKAGPAIRSEQHQWTIDAGGNQGIIDAAGPTSVRADQYAI